jgi:hypothetical protein
MAKTPALNRGAQARQSDEAAARRDLMSLLGLPPSDGPRVDRWLARWEVQRKYNDARQDEDDSLKKKGPKKKNQDRVEAGKKGGKERVARQRLVLEQGPTEILTALNALVRMILAREDLWGLKPVRELHCALGEQGRLFLGEHMPTPEGDEAAQYAAIMVLSPMVNGLDEMTNLIGPSGPGGARRRGGHPPAPPTHRDRPPAPGPRRAHG